MKNNLISFVGGFLIFFVVFFFFKEMLLMAFSLLRARCDRVIRHGERSCSSEYTLKDALLITVKEHLRQL